MAFARLNGEPLVGIHLGLKNWFSTPKPTLFQMVENWGLKKL